MNSKWLQWVKKKGGKEGKNYMTKGSHDQDVPTLCVFFADRYLNRICIQHFPTHNIVNHDCNCVQKHMSSKQGNNLKQRMHSMTRSAFTLSYDTMSYKTYDIVSMRHSHFVLREKVSYDDHFVQSRVWICAVSAKTEHCALCSCDLNEWQAPSYTNLVSIDVHIGRKGRV